MALRTVWHEVLEARRRQHLANTAESWETWRADQWSLWLADLGDGLVLIEDRVHGDDAGDPRAALIELMAVASAWVDSMGKLDGEA